MRQGWVGKRILLEMLKEQPLQLGRKALQTVFELGGNVWFAAVLEGGGRGEGGGEEIGGIWGGLF